MPDRAVAVEGWFTTGDEPALIGTRCADCGTFHFPPERFFCRNPSCNGTTLEDVPLSRRGTVWSFTVNHYPPPPPAVSPDPFEAYAVAAVELAAEAMVVLGQVSGDPSRLEIGGEVEVVVEPLPDGPLVWKWRPL
jgi:hypothetical protein